MTIKNFTFFSPNGTEFPVGSNNDGKLYMMLTGMDYKTIRRKDWSNPITTALNIQYTNTSIIAGGRYFELLNETIALTANAVNYIHANIDLTKTTNPVSLSAETSDNSNNVDINNGSGVLKVCFDVVTTSSTGVISTQPIVQTSILDNVSTKSLTVDRTAQIGSLSVSRGVSSKIYETKHTTPSFEAQYFRVGNMVTMTTHTIVGIAQTTYYDIPVGFRPYNNGTNPLFEQQFSSGATAILRSSNATWQPRSSGGIGANLYATTTYPTNDPFPTS